MGLATGLHGISSVENAIIVDSLDVFKGIKKGLERIHGGEQEGLPGFRSIVGTHLGLHLIITLIPPYPAAIAETLMELFVFGVRRAIVITSGYRLRKNIDENSILIVQGSVPLDGVSKRIAGEGLPLLASQDLLTLAKNVIDVRFSNFERYIGFSVTIDSPRLPWAYSDVEEYIGARGVVAVDSIAAPAYALQYMYPRLDVLVLATLNRYFTPSTSPASQTYESYARVLDQEKRNKSILYLVALEMFKGLEV